VLFRTKLSAIQPTSVKKPIIPIIAAIPDILTSYLLFGLGLAIMVVHEECQMDKLALN
jgi:hypothetical protein